MLLFSRQHGTGLLISP